MADWQEVVSGVFRFVDSCNVYAVAGPSGVVIIDAGSGAWWAHREQLPGPIVALLCTHYFRDHAAGAGIAAAAGIPVYVPAAEREIFEEPEEHFRRRETYNIYDNLWDLYAPIQGIATAGGLLDYDSIDLAGIRFEVVPLPGATVHQIGFACRLTAAGPALVFCAEAIHSPGRVPRVAPFQYNYNDFGGAVNACYSAQQLQQRQPDWLLPSLGQPISGDVAAALDLLQTNLRALLSARAGTKPLLDRLDNTALIKVTDHLWQSAVSGSINWYLLSESGKVLVIDYGYNGSLCFPGQAIPINRRVMLHDLDALQQQFGRDRIDVVLVSHFHDDHVCGIPLLQRLYDTECWAADNFADLLEQPEAHAFPCTWRQPMRVDRRFGLEETVQWEEYTFHFGAMSGHTRFASLIGFEVDGQRVAHTGDQYFFMSGNGPFNERTRLQNHVYRNGALLGGYDQSGDWLAKFRPDIVITGHEAAYRTDDHFFAQIEAWRHDYRVLHQRAMPLAADQMHFDLDSWGGWIWPYRSHLTEPGPIALQVTVRNPQPHPAQLEVRLLGPRSWTGSETVLAAGAREEVSCTLTITPDGPCRRQPIAIDLTVDGQPCGQVAEALVTVGGNFF